MRKKTLETNKKKVRKNGKEKKYRKLKVKELHDGSATIKTDFLLFCSKALNRQTEINTLID